ncbi:GNAT family N-acetyltransferase [Catellatospora tritici]|uniref:GNAT family N-acetyltransferase n=1 Tax=Catellatospora tritici TaxID=2851566 RepID=UPI0020C4C29D|nr:GNAT family protein [Catellatospora tritici]
MIGEVLPVARGVVMRTPSPADADAIAQAYLRNREHLRPWEPQRDEEFFTTAAHAARVLDQLALAEAGHMAPWLLDDGEQVLGAVTLSNIMFGPLRSANLGYWVDAGQTGRGLATAAVAVACRIADERLGLHRLQAGTLVDNAASQRVLTKSGFEHIGTARDYLHIDGQWRDHVLFQKILNNRPAF